MEARVALGVLLERFAELRVTPGVPLQPYAQGVLGVRSLPMTARAA